MKKIPILLLLFFCLGKSAQSQTIRTIDSLETIKQDCVDGNEPGRSPIYCIGRFRDQLDNLMQVVFQQLYDRAGAAYKQELAKEQKAWLERKVNSETDIDANKKEGLNEAELRIYRYEAKTAFLRDRVKFLVSKL
jgi:uncharacterized protein YecT (DUF1311 family)